MFNSYRYIIVFCLIMLGAFEQSIANERIDAILYFQDEKHQYTIQNIDNPAIAKLFTEIKRNEINGGFSQAYFWIKIIVPELPENKNYFLECSNPHIDLITFYQKNKSGGWDSITAGNKFSYNKRVLPYRQFYFPLSSDKANFYLLKVKNKGSLRMKLKLISQNKIGVKQSYMSLVYGLFFGFIAFIFFYNLILSISLRDINYLCFSVFLLISFFFYASLSGYAFQYLWGSSPFWNQYSIPVFVAGLLASSAWFTSEFLSLKRLSAKLEHVFLIHYIAALLIVILSFLTPYNTAITIAFTICLFALLSYLVFGWRAWRNGYTLTRSFILSWIIYLTGCIIYVAYLLGVIGNTVIIQHAIEISFVVFVMMILYSLTEKYKILQRENEQSRDEIIKIQKEANESLEKTIRKRTSVLREKISELKETQRVIEEYNHELEKLSIVASKTDNAIMIMDENGTFEWFNEGFTRLYGYTFAEYVKEKSNNILDTCTTPFAKEGIRTCIREKKTVNYESLMIDKFFKRMWIQTTVTPILDEQGNISKLVAIDTDISKLKDAETEILQQKEEIAGQRDEIEKQRDEANKQRKKVTDSILYAQKIQDALLPPNEVIASAFDEHFIIFRPRDIVSGDFYWFRKIKQNGRTYYLIAVADCTGHGVPGAFVSMLGISFLHETINKFLEQKSVATIKASHILDDLRMKVIKSLRQSNETHATKDGIDMALCVIDIQQMKLQYSGAFNPMILIRKTYSKPVEPFMKKRTKIEMETINQGWKYELMQIRADKMPIGIQYRTKAHFTNHYIELQKGDAIYLFSDGYIDQFGGKRDRKFLSTNFRSLLLKIQDKTMNEQKQMLEQTLDEWQGDNEQLDDILVLGIKI